MTGVGWGVGGERGFRERERRCTCRVLYSSTVPKMKEEVLYICMYRNVPESGTAHSHSSRGQPLSFAVKHEGM